MLPYKEGKNVIIDPTIPNKDLRFGTVPEKLYKMMGKIVKSDYWRKEKCMTYQVQFDGINRLFWFIEKELA